VRLVGRPLDREAGAAEQLGDGVRVGPRGQHDVVVGGSLDRLARCDGRHLHPDRRRHDARVGVRAAQERRVVDAVEERHDERAADGRRRTPGERAEQARRLHRDEQRVDALGQRGRRARGRLHDLVAVAQGHAADEQRGGGPLASDQRHVVARLSEPRRHQQADAAGAEDRDAHLRAEPLSPPLGSGRRTR
jgi:hypothetical protein